MPDLSVKQFMGVFEKGSKFDLPVVFAETCKDFLLTHPGKLVKRKGYANATLGTAAFRTNGLTGNIINAFELDTGRVSDGTAPDVSRKYFIQTDGGVGKIYLWDDNTRTWSQIDHNLSSFVDEFGDVKKCQFIADGGMVRVLAGIRSVSNTLIWGYVGERFTHAISANAGTKTPISAAFMSACELSSIPRPTMSDYITLSKHVEESGVTWLSGIGRQGAATDIYHYKISIQYDNKQWSVPSKFNLFGGYLSLTEDIGRNSILININSASETNRLTGIKIYRGILKSSNISSQGAFGLSPSAFKLIYEAYVHCDLGTHDSPNSVIWPYLLSSCGATYTVEAGPAYRFTLIDTLSNDDALSNDMLNGGILSVRQTSGTGLGDIRYCQIKDVVFVATNDQYIEVESGTDLVDGETYSIKVINGWYKNGDDYQYLFVDDIDQEIAEASTDSGTDLGITMESTTDVNANYGAMVENLMFYLDIYHNGEAKRSVIAYGFRTSDGLIANDVHHMLNVFTVGFPIIKGSSVGNRLVLYGYNKIARGIIPTANQSTWDFERLYDGYGLLAPDSLVTIAGKDYFLASDRTIRVFDGMQKPISIGGSIYDTLNTAGDTDIAYLEDAVGFHLSRLNMYVLRIQTATSTYEYWGYPLFMDNPGWIRINWKDSSGDDINFVSFFNGIKGQTWAVTATGIFELHSGTTDNGTPIDPTYKTLPMSIDKKLIHHLQEIIAIYQSDTTIEIDIYLDGSTTALTQADATCEAKTSVGILAKNTPLGSNGRYCQVEITITDDQLPSNADLEIDEIQIPVEVSGGSINV